MEKEILVNQLFAGGYLSEGENIGHEVINLFRDDERHNNLFITPSGHVKGHDVEHIIFVRNIAARKTVEVIGKADALSIISKDEINRIRYAGVSLDQIFNKNTYHGETDIFTDHVTFRAENFRFPSNRIFITIDPAFNSSESVIIHLNTKRKVIIPQGMREYYSASVDADAYKQLMALVEDNDCWEAENTTEKLIPDGPVYSQSPSFLEVIRKEDDENIFSNLLGYFFEYSHSSFAKFAAEPSLLDIQGMSTSFTLLRETIGRVDLWIEGENDIIVIENKIKSGINGITGNDYSQLNKYHEIAEKDAKEKGKTSHYYIFAPDYAKFDLDQFGLKQTYKVIKYSDIYDFFVRETATYIADRVFPDFLRGLKRHTLSLPELQFETMRSRLLRKTI